MARTKGALALIPSAKLVNTPRQKFYIKQFEEAGINGPEVFAALGAIIKDYAHNPKDSLAAIKIYLELTNGKTTQKIETQTINKNYNLNRELPAVRSDLWAIEPEMKTD